MSAQLIYDLAPLGSVIRYCDGTPRPPERHRKKLSAWESANGGGRLIRKTPARQTAQYSSPAQFTLHEGDYGSGGVIVLRVHKRFSVDCGLNFAVTSRPAPSSVRVFDRAGEGAELVYLAASRQDAEVWLQSHRYPNAVLEPVSADTVAADVVEGRAVHPHLRSVDGFYEEDCCWAAVAQAFPDLFTDFEKRCAEETIRRWYPDVWPRSLTCTPRRLREVAS